MMSHMISWQVRMIWIDSDAELTVFSHTNLSPHAIMILLCCDDKISSMAN